MRGRARRPAAASASCGLSRVGAVTDPVRVLIAEGGTAGHVVPALAIADALRAEGAHVEFAGGERAEAELVPAAGYPFHPLKVAGLDRRNPLKAARAAALAAGSVFRARKLIHEIRP